LFPNIIDDSDFPVIENPSKDYYIHVGTLTIIKGINNLYELVNMLDKNNPIVIVGNAGDSKSKKILSKIAENKNVIFKGSLSHSETIKWIANSKGLINTSNYEGFPNIFLEAWATGVPVISLNVNPGDVFNRYELGACCNGDMNKMKNHIESGDIVNIDKKKLIAYVAAVHGFATAADRFLDFLN
jgi:glycosyltransferase involved in cell wall biosynthesis